MVSKKEREEVWQKLKPYMDNKDTIEDLLPICYRCEGWSIDNNSKEWCEDRKTCPVFQLWLSNKYLEWYKNSLEF